LAAAEQGTAPAARPPRTHLALRLIRITAIAGGLAYMFHWSREQSFARGNGDVPGMSAAIGALSFLFFIRALLMEGAESSATGMQKDLLWGLCAGGVVTILMRL
jgi:hypothetical protein